MLFPVIGSKAFFSEFEKTLSQQTQSRSAHLVKQLEYMAEGADLDFVALFIAQLVRVEEDWAYAAGLIYLLP
jgi:hypothetical protein